MQTSHPGLTPISGGRMAPPWGAFVMGGTTQCRGGGGTGELGGGPQGACAAACFSVAAAQTHTASEAATTVTVPAHGKPHQVRHFSSTIL